MDTWLFRTVNHVATRTGWLHPVAVGYAKDGIALFALALAAGWWIARDQDDTESSAALVCTVVAVFVALGAAQLLGHLVDRARPYDAIAGARVLVDRTTDFSFPSDHATVAGAVAGGLWLLDRRLGHITVGLAVVMAASRVYVGAHYPSDVLAGLVLGAVVAAAGVRGLGSTVARLLDRAATTRLEPLIRRRRPAAERV
jgi:undecaprenyl-diphosphatase